LAFNPDCFVDIHGMAGGSMLDRVWLTPVLPFSPTAFFVVQMAAAAHARCEQAGYPVCEVKPPLRIDPQRSTRGQLGEMIAFETGALCFGLEAIEEYYGEKEWREAGLTRLKTLLEFGTRDAFGIGEPGYPCSLVSGYRVAGLKAHGQTAQARRENRRDLVAFLKHNFAIVSRGSDGLDGLARVTVRSDTVNGVNPGRFSVLLRFKKPCTVRSVTWQGAPLDSRRDHGYFLHDDAATMQMQVDIQEPLGGPERFLEVRYDSPWLPAQ
jgi:hypothetical protein